MEVTVDVFVSDVVRHFSWPWSCGWGCPHSFKLLFTLFVLQDLVNICPICTSKVRGAIGGVIPEAFGTRIMYSMFAQEIVLQNMLKDILHDKIFILSYSQCILSLW